MAADRREDLLGRLLGVPLDRFVEQRNRLARELREQGDRESALWLAGLRRPAPAVWALDQLARGDPGRITALLDLGAELRAAQTRAMRGDREAAAEMRELSGRVQRAVDDAVRRAGALLRDAGHGTGPDTVHAMAASLRAALAADDTTRSRLAAGLLLQPVEAAEGFGFDMAAGPALRVIEGGGGGRGAAPAAPETRQEEQDRERRLQEARRRAEAAIQAADQAEARAEQLRRQSAELHQRAAEVRARIRALEDDLHEAEVAARRADVAVRDAVTSARDARLQADTASAESGEKPE